MRITAIVVGSLLLLIAGTYGTLVYAGVIKIGQQTRGNPSPPPLSSEEIMVPISIADLPPNTEIRREVLVNPKTGRVAMQRILRKTIEGKHVITDPAQMIGLVLNHEKRPGYMFSEGDFYPRGTNPDGSAPIPPDMVAVTLPAGKLLGSKSLRPRDRLDITSGQKYDPAKIHRGPGPGLNVQQEQIPVENAFVQVLVTDGIVLTPVTIEKVISGSSKNGTPTYKATEQIQIAVKLTEAADIAKAVESGANLMCFVRSGRPGATTQPIVVTAQATPAADQVMVEKVIGPRHVFVPVSTYDVSPSAVPTMISVSAPTTRPSQVP